MKQHDALARRLGTGDAVTIGLGSMIGAGLFAAFAPAAQAPGSGLIIGLLIAAMVAYANAASSAQLAAQYPTSGGTYVYGRERLGPWWGFLAGWGFVLGKTASCAAMALTFAVYAAPDGWERPVAVLAVALLATVNYRGVTRTAKLTRVIVTVVLTALAMAVFVSLLFGDPQWSRVSPWAGVHGGWYGLLQSAGLLFFAFAGYARIATMGEEVRDPTSTIAAGGSARAGYHGGCLRRDHHHLARRSGGGWNRRPAPRWPLPSTSPVRHGPHLSSGSAARLRPWVRCSPSSRASAEPAWPWRAKAT